MSVDHYAILRIGRSATLQEIKSAYRARAKETYPKTGNDAANFLRVQQAYETLKDPKTRAEFDESLSSIEPNVVAYVSTPSGHDTAHFTGRTGYDRTWSQHDEAWAKYYRERGRRKRRAKPEPTRVTSYWSDSSNPPFSVTLTLQQAYEGVTVYLSKAKKVLCDRCAGRGFILSHGPKCTVCDGSGKVDRKRLVDRLMFRNRCLNCEGIGLIKIQINCECRNGLQTMWEETSVVVVRGALNDTVIPLRGGDSLRVKVQDSVNLARCGDDVKFTKELSEEVLKRGTTVKIKCLDSIERRVKVPAGSSVGYEIIVPGCGMPKQSGAGFGDLIVVIERRSD